MILKKTKNILNIKYWVYMKSKLLFLYFCALFPKQVFINGKSFCFTDVLLSNGIVRPKYYRWEVMLGINNLEQSRLITNEGWISTLFFSPYPTSQIHYSGYSVFWTVLEKYAIWYCLSILIGCNTSCYAASSWVDNIDFVCKCSGISFQICCQHGLSKN